MKREREQPTLVLSEEVVKEIVDKVRGEGAAELQIFQYLQQRIPEATREELAPLLQLELRQIKREESLRPEGEENDKKPPQIQPLKRPVPKTLYPPKDYNCRVPYLRSKIFKEPVASSDFPDWYRRTPLLKGQVEGGVVEDRDPELLTPWSRLWPFLHNLLSEHQELPQIDIPKVIDSAVRRQPLKTIPWQQKLLWPNTFVLVVDFSHHLHPFYSDYRFLVENICAWFRHRVYLVFCTDSERQTYLFNGRTYEGFPLMEEKQLLLYVGDLGFLSYQKVAAGLWTRLAKKLHEKNCRIDGLLTVSPNSWEFSISRLVRLHHWDTNLSTPVQVDTSNLSRNVAQDHEQTEILLACLSWCFEISQPLVRKVRQKLGLSISVESLVFQHPALCGNFRSYQWRSRELRSTYRDKWDSVESDFSTLSFEQLWEIIVSYESHMPVELQVEQRQQAGREISVKQKEYLQRLIKSLMENSLDTEQATMLLDWIGRVGIRAGEEEWCEECNLLYSFYQEFTGTESIPSGVSLTDLPDWRQPAGEVNPAAIVQRRGGLEFVADSENEAPSIEISTFPVTGKSEISYETPHSRTKRVLRPGSQLAWRKKISRIVCENELETQHVELLQQPSWASGIGRDRYGLFVEVGLKEVGFVLRWIPPGKFLMGSPKEEPERYEDEGPQHKVHFEEGFWLAETACSQALWLEVMKENPSRFSDNLENPVETVSLQDIQGFLAALNRRIPGLEARLPSEAEWEYSCRAGTTTPFWFGDSLTVEDANYNGNHPYDKGIKGEYRNKTLPVRSFRPNPWGLYQMHGNVWEFCSDSWHDSYDGALGDGSSWESGTAENRVRRGGSWLYSGGGLRSAFRHRTVLAYDDRGFRLARGPEKRKEPEVGEAAYTKRGTSGEDASRIELSNKLDTLGDTLNNLSDEIEKLSDKKIV